MTGLINLLRPGDQDRDSTTQGADKRGVYLMQSVDGLCLYIRTYIHTSVLYVDWSVL